MAIVATRAGGAAFALACQTYGVDTPQCPLADLQAWATLSATRYPTAYAETFAPLLASYVPRLALTTPATIAEPGEQYRREAFASAAKQWISAIQSKIPRASARIHL